MQSQALKQPKILPHGQAVVSRALLRDAMRRLLPTVDDLNGFCCDFFPEVHARFSSGMNRLQRDNLLLEFVAPEELLSGLFEQLRNDDKRCILLKNLLSSATQRQAVAPQNEHQEQLEALYQERKQLQLARADLDAINTRIVELKRQLRVGPQLSEGEILADRYRLREIIGRGGFAKIWLAFDREANDFVAIKVLHSDQAADRNRIDRFFRGARQMRNLTHPHIVRVLDGPAEYEGFYYVVMNYLPGGDLNQVVAARNRAQHLLGLYPRLTRAKALAAVLQVGEALEYAHQRGLIHRDVKPHNILLDAQGKAYLSDFDLVWAPDSTGHTRTGAMGTYIYAAPEALEDGSRVDARADVYSLGMSAVFVVYRQSLKLRVVEDRAGFIEHLDCSAQLKAVLRSAVHSDRGQRPPNMRALCDALRSAVDEDTKFRREGQIISTAHFIQPCSKNTDHEALNGSSQERKLSSQLINNEPLSNLLVATEVLPSKSSAPESILKGEIDTEARNALDGSIYKDNLDAQSPYSVFLRIVDGLPQLIQNIPTLNVPAKAIFLAALLLGVGAIWKLSSHPADALVASTEAVQEHPPTLPLDMTSKAATPAMRSQVATLQKESPVPEPPSPTQPSTNVKSSDPHKQTLDAAKALNEAVRLRKNGDFNGAIVMARRATQKRPKQAWTIIGATECDRRNPNISFIRETLNRINKRGQEIITKACKKNGIDPDFLEPFNHAPH